MPDNPDRFRLRAAQRGAVANVAKLVDALDLGSSGATLGSSSLPIRTNYLCDLNFSLILGLPGQNRYDAVHVADFCNHAFLLYFLR